jgi:predicted membrane metal-binding protein
MPVSALLVAVIVMVAAWLAVGGRAALLVAVCCLIGGLWWGALRAEALERSFLAKRVGSPADAVVAITGPTRRTRFNQRVEVQVRRLDGEPLRERTMLELPLGRSPPQGALLSLRVRLRAPRSTDDGFDERALLARRGIHAVLRGGDDWRVVGRRGGLAGLGDRLRRHLESSIASGLRGERRAVIAGIFLGEDEGMTEELRDDFRASGLYHLLRVYY